LDDNHAIAGPRYGTHWGGSIVEVSVNGTNFVNADDTGQEVQPAFYDGNARPVNLRL